MKTIMCAILIFAILCGVAVAENNSSVNNTSNEVLVKEIVNQTSIHVYNKTSDQLVNDTINGVGKILTTPKIVSMEVTTA